MGFLGCLEATRAPTSGKIRNTPDVACPAREKFASQLPGTSAARTSTNSKNWAAHRVTESAASDHARNGARATPVRSLVFASSITIHSTALPSPSRYGKRYGAEVYGRDGDGPRGISPNDRYT